MNALGDFAPDVFGHTARRDFCHLLTTHGLTLTALAFPTRQGFNAEEGLESRIEALKKVLTLSFDLRSPIVTGAAGRIAEDLNHPARKMLVDATSEIGRHADRVGARFALETGTESGATLAAFLQSIGSPGLAANLDPANLIIKGYEPIQAVYDLGPAIVHSHAHDALYESGGELGREVNPGDGVLDWPRYLAALEEIGYRGWFVIERDASLNPESDISRAVRYLRDL